MNSVLKKILIFLVIFILSIGLGIYAGYKSTSDYNTSSLDFSNIASDVKVYRNKYGIPTIIAENNDDLFFAQGYEYARDRLWQAEYYRSLANGELSRLFGEDLVDSDRFLRTLSLKQAAEDDWAKTNDENKKYVTRYVEGLNQYIDDHLDNLPLEFQLLNLNMENPLQPFDIKPKKWTVIDSFAIQGVMSYDLSFGGLRRELLRQDLAIEFGVDKALELMPIPYKPAADYFLSLNASDLIPIKNSLTSLKFVSNPRLGLGIGSNNWVVSGNKTKSGLPILSNDPHLGLSTPGIWWQVHLYSPGYHVEGYSLPGIPGIIIGHNEYVSWGMTNTGTDAVDLFYFNTRKDSTGEYYYLNNTWKQYREVEHQIPVKGGDVVSYRINYTDYGPILDPDVFNLPEDSNYALRWTLLENHPREITIHAILGLNKAKSADDIHAALKNFGVPGQNIVYATVQGDIGYQYTGLTPIRKTEGSGILPQNGSSNNFGWNGMVAYEDQYRERNPSKGYFSSANEKIDTRDNFYITDKYDVEYRGNRIKQVLEKNNSLTVENMIKLQADTFDLAVFDMLRPFIPGLKSAAFEGENSDLIIEAIAILDNWDSKMDRESVGAMIYETFRIYLEEFTFKDEMDDWTGGDDLYERYNSLAIHAFGKIAGNLTSEWFDDESTKTKKETGDNIAKRAIIQAITFLKDELGSNINSWKWGRLHKAIFEHPFGTSIPFLNFHEGMKSSDGSDTTLNAAGDTPRWTKNGPLFDQSSGPSMRLVATVEPKWSDVWGVLTPGESGNYGNPHRGDGVDDWINVKHREWNFSTENKTTPSFTFRKK